MCFQHNRKICRKRNSKKIKLFVNGKRGITMSDNRRVRMTKKMIKDAYLELLETNPSEKISVTDICKVADVNRSTFYMYYEDTVILRQDIENDVLEQIPVLSGIPETITSDKEFVDVLEKFFSYIQENHRMFRILILQSDNRAFNRRLIETVLEKYRTEVETLNNPLLAKYEYVFITSGVIGLLGSWIEDNFPINAKKFSQIVLQMALMAAEIENIEMK